MVMGWICSGLVGGGRWMFLFFFHFGESCYNMMIY
jgi:hypothetical protein